MGKRALFAVFLSLLVITGYNYFLSQKYPHLAQRSSSLRPAVQQEQIPSISPAVIETYSQQEAPILTEPTGATDITVETDLLHVVLTSSGARIKSCQLKQYPEEKLDRAAVQKRLLEIEQSLARAGQEAQKTLLREQAKQAVLLEKLAVAAPAAELISLPAIVDGDFWPAIGLADQQVSLELNTGLYDVDRNQLWLNTQSPTGQLTFTYTDPQGRQTKKRFTFNNSNYSIELDIEFLGWESSPLPEQFLLFAGPDIGMPQAQRGRRGSGYQGPVSCFLSGQQSWLQKEKYGRHEQNIFVQREHKQKGTILWTGLENKYFLSALIPEQPAESVIVEKNRFGEQKVALNIPWPGSRPYKAKLYLGPKKKERLQEVDATLDKAIDYGFFGPISKLIYRVLLFFSQWTHNFGWAIVLLCLVTKFIFYPLTHRSFESMQKMQHEMKSIQPEMDALRERLKDSPQKLNKEIMELYRKKGINPLASCQSGCLPMLLQMPVFFALYSVLYNSIELRGTPFFGWITDLSAKDPYYVLPVLMGVSMFAQQKLSGLSGGAGGGAQQDQAKMMAVMMPILLTWIFASLPAGVVLYWLTFNIVTAGQQLLIKRKQESTSLPTQTA
ncbi:membrane protein insertase YidC [Candidatus Omnitrophota bacterium]